MKTRGGEIPPASSAARWLDHCEVDDAARLARGLDANVPDTHAIQPRANCRKPKSWLGVPKLFASRFSGDKCRRGSRLNH